MDEKGESPVRNGQALKKKKNDDDDDDYVDSRTFFFLFGVVLIKERLTRTFRDT